MTGFRLDRNGVTLYYEVHGTPSERPPLALTHGYAATSQMWQTNLAALSKDRQVVTWDMRGHGRTVTPHDLARYTQEESVKDLAAILDACGIEHAGIGGLSLGGYLALAFYAANPTRVAALLLFDTGPGFKQDDSRRRWNVFAESQAEAFEQHGRAALPDSPEVRDGLHDPVGLAYAARGILVQSDAQVINSLASIDVPTLVLVGENDRPFLASADYMAAKIPAAVKHVIANAGHASNIDQPAAFSAVVTAFLARYV